MVSPGRRIRLVEICRLLRFNSGRTKEVVLLAQHWAPPVTTKRLWFSANPGTMLEQACSQTWVLNCGMGTSRSRHQKCCRTNLFYESILWNIQGKDMTTELAALPELIDTSLTCAFPGTSWPRL